MSSFLGGKGSLRGACTQPCRRRYVSGKKRGYFFSPTDLDASRVMARIRQIPLAALKIEGRMKGPEYVTRVVRAYRLLLDTPLADMNEALQEAEALLAESLGRHRSTGFFLSNTAESGLSPVHAATSGLFLGQITTGGPESGALSLRESLSVGDRLRVQFKANDERNAFTLKNMTRNNTAVDSAEPDDEVRIVSPVSLSAGDLIFKVGAANDESDALASPLTQALKITSVKAPSPSRQLKNVLARLNTLEPGRPRAGKRPELWYPPGQGRRSGRS